MASAALWVAVDVLRGERFVTALWAALPPRHENEVKALVLVGCGWAGWAVTLSEVFRLLAGTRQQRPV